MKRDMHMRCACQKNSQATRSLFSDVTFDFFTNLATSDITRTICRDYFVTRNKLIL